MADVRFVPKSATTPATKRTTKRTTKMAGALALVGALAGAGALLVWGCTDNSGNGKFVEPNRPFPTDGASAAVDGSTDGATWGPKPVTNFPQKFYQAEHPLLLDLTAHPEAKFLRAHWEVGRWGRGSETPMFEFNVTIREVPSEILKEATAEAKAMV